MTPWHDCAPCHLRPDGTAGVNADGGLTDPPDYPNRLADPRQVSPRASLAACCPGHLASTATAGRQHPLCLATAPCTQPNLLGPSPHRLSPLPRIPCRTGMATSLRWIRAKPWSGFGVAGTVGSRTPPSRRIPASAGSTRIDLSLSHSLATCLAHLPEISVRDAPAARSSPAYSVGRAAFQ